MHFPLEAYFDPSIFDKEREQFFLNYSSFVGTANLVPNDGDYHVLEQSHNSRVLVNNGGNLSVLGNICKHRQAQLLSGSGNVMGKRIVCPIHKWSYDYKGKLVTAPHFRPKPKTCLNKDKLWQHNGFLFSEQATMKAFAASPAGNLMDANKYVLIDSTAQDYAINWKEYLDVFLDNYHINYYHPGLRSLVDTRKLEWEFGERFNFHRVKFNTSFYKGFGSDKMNRFADEMKKQFGEIDYGWGARWLVLYPNVYMEFFPHFCFTGILVPESIRSTKLFIRAYAEKEIADNSNLIEAFHEAMNEVDAEDYQILLNISNGRWQLYNSGLEDDGPYHHPTETGMKVFHEWIRSHVQ